MALSFAIEPGQTPEQVRRRRELIAMMLASQPPADTIGGGVGQLLTGIGAGIANHRANKAAAAGQAGAANKFAPIIAALGGGFPDAPPAPQQGMPGGTGAAPAAPQMSQADPNVGSTIDFARGEIPSGGGDVRQGLIDRGMPEHIADAFVMNFKDESGLDPSVNEKAPLVPGSRGGFGLAQWTGPRRKALEAFAAQRGTDVADMGTQLDFLMTELQGPESRAWQAIQSAPDAGSAAAAIVNQFLRPAEVHRASREARYLGSQQPPVQVASLDPGIGVAPDNMSPMDPSIGVAPGGPILPDAGIRASLDRAVPTMPQVALPDTAPIPQPMPGQGGAAPAPGGGVQQVAQALQGQQMPPPPPQAVQSDMPGMTPRNPQQGPAIGDLLQAAQDPWTNPQQMGIIQMLLEQEMQKNQPPKYDFITGRDGSIFRGDSSGNLEQVYGGKPEQFRVLSQDEETQFGLDPSKSYQMGPDNKISAIGGDSTTVNVNNQAENTFDKELAGAQAKAFNTMAEEGLNARADLAVIGELEGLLKGQGGALTGLLGILAQKGIDVGGATSDLQAAQALINKLVPTQRQAGSGSMSDRDVELFTRSLPSLWNTPEGNTKILNVMKGLAQYKQAQGEIADQVILGEKSRQEARRALRDLPNPLAEFRDFKPSQASDPNKPPASYDGDPGLWQFMTPEQRKLWQ